MVLLKENIPNKVGNYGNGHHAKDVYDPNYVSPTITTGNHGLGQTIVDQSLEKKERKKGIPIRNATKQGYLEANVGDGVDISTRMETHRGTVQKDTCQTLTCQGGENVGVVIDEQETNKVD